MSDNLSHAIDYIKMFQRNQAACHKCALSYLQKYQANPTDNELRQWAIDWQEHARYWFDLITQTKEANDLL